MCFHSAAVVPSVPVFAKLTMMMMALTIESEREKSCVVQKENVERVFNKAK